MVRGLQTYHIYPFAPTDTHQIHPSAVDSYNFLVNQRRLLELTRQPGPGMNADVK